MDKEFEKAYKQLNPKQKEAVDQIDGPVLVIAGPGTGKTQLLALRAANILKKDPTVLPNNILCLTFTDAASDNLRERLIRYIGQDAYRVGVYTFHAYGAHIMSLYPEYFFAWRETKTADSLTTHRLLEEILGTLPGDHELAAHGSDGTFYAMRQLKSLIADAKKSNISPDDLRDIIADNQRSCEELLPKIRSLWPATMAGADLSKIAELVTWMAGQEPGLEPASGVVCLKNMVISSLAEAAGQSMELSGRAQTKPFTSWKDSWLLKDGRGQWIFAIQNQTQKLQAAADIYEQYQEALRSRGLADFSDQISWVLRALAKNEALRLNLQERYQYIMIDEFQDTNRAQLQMARYLTDAPAHENQPNILAVGDDDQAIYRFQGADIANIDEFESAYPSPKIIPLITNYRSNPPILGSSQLINSQIQVSLAKQKQIDKSLKATVKVAGAGVILNEFAHDAQHYAWVADKIKQQLKATDGNQIAVLARERAQLDALMPYLRHLNIPVDYERRENVLDQEHIVTLLTMARLVNLLGSSRLDEANSLLPQVLSEPMWNIEPIEIWQIASQAYKTKQLWLDVIYRRKNSPAKPVADFLVSLASLSGAMPLEQLLDLLIGTNPTDTESETGDIPPTGQKSTSSFTSPFKEYFFSDELRAGNPAQYLSFLSHLSTLRNHLRNYQTGERRTLVLSDLIEFCDAYTRAELRMVDLAPHREDHKAIKLMTVHGAKGLEFEDVFVIGLQERVWTKSGNSNRFSYPANLQEIKPSDNQDDDGLRLLFVAMTRAKQNLYLNYFKRDEDGKEHQPYAPLLALGLTPNKPEVKTPTPVSAEQYEQRWLSRHASVKKASMLSMLQEDLDRYQLSATHLNNFTDVTSGGPLFFLTQNLLNFPSAINPYSIYGTLIHSALARAHQDARHGRGLNIDNLVAHFKTELAAQALSQEDKARFSKDGEHALRVFLAARGNDFTTDQEVEYDFTNQGVCIGEARIKGFVDLIEMDKGSKTVRVYDYKTGGALSSWSLPPSAREYDRIKAHKFRQQLLFYKLLVDGASDLGQKGWSAQSGCVEFVEPDIYGKLRSLTLDYDKEETDRTKQLVKAVWKRIQGLDLPDTSKYPKSLAGILEFEQDLLQTKTPGN